MKKVVSEISGIVFSLPWLVAKDHGLFEAEGIDMEFVRARGGGLTPNDFHLLGLRYVHPTPYTYEIVEDTYNWMTRWGLLTDTACSADLVDNRITEPVSADD